MQGADPMTVHPGQSKLQPSAQRGLSDAFNWQVEDLDITASSVCFREPAGTLVQAGFRTAEQILNHSSQVCCVKPGHTYRYTT